MSVIKVETFDVDVGSGTTHTLTNDIGNLADGFIRHIGSTDKGSGGPTAATTDTAPNIVGIGMALTATNTITFYRSNTTTAKVIGEVWRYTGVASGVDEFIVRGRYAVTIAASASSQTQTLSGITNRNDVVPFLQGYVCASASVSDYEMATVAVHINSSGDLVVSRNNSGATAVTAYVTVVEFTGSNWSVGHAFASAHDSVAQTVVLNTDSTGLGGSTFDTGDWLNAFIEASMEGDSAETGLADVVLSVVPSNDTTKVVVSSVAYDANARNDGAAYVHAITNRALSVHRRIEINLAEGNGTYGTAPWPTGAPTTELLDELALEWFVGSSGTGTAHARGRLNARITVATGTIQHWVHRSGNTVRADYGVIDLSNILNVVPVTVTAAPTATQNTVANQTITGTNFKATQSTGKVELWSDTSGTTKVNQSIDSWSDTSIQFDLSAGALADSIAYLVVTNSDGVVSNKWKISVGFASYDPMNDVVFDHFWTMQNTWDDSGVQSSHPCNIAQVGPPTFQTTQKIRGMSYSMRFTASTDHTEVADSAYTNVTNTHTNRTMGGWVYLDAYQETPAIIYEEGGGVNNFYMLVGFGNILLGNCADSNGSPAFKVQAYSDRPLRPGRWYHVMIEFTGGTGFELYVDGVKQASTDGNPIADLTFSTHSGDWSFGRPDTTLDTGDTDIQYQSAVTMFLTHWGTASALGSGSPIILTDMRKKLYENGAPHKYEIASGTEAAMQTAIGAYDSTDHDEFVSMVYQIGDVTGGGNVALTITDQTFHEEISAHGRWLGSGTLTIVNDGTSDTVASKWSTPMGGTVIVSNPPELKLTGLKNPTEVRVYDAGTQTEITGVEDVTTGVFTTTIDEIAYPDVDIVVHSLGWQYMKLRSVDMTGGDVSLPITQRVDRQYENV